MKIAYIRKHATTQMARSVQGVVLVVLASASFSPTMANDWDNGSGDANWSNAVNWSGNIEPHSGTSALFPAGFPNGDTNIILSPNEAAFLLSVGDDYTFRNFIPSFDDATLTLADGVLHVVGGKTATIRVRLFSDNRLLKTGAGTASLQRTTDIDGGVYVEDGTLSIQGALLSASGLIAEDPGSAAVVTVSGASAIWNISGALFGGSLILGEGNGSLNITGGGQVQNTGLVFLGDSSGSTATVNVSDAGSAWTIPFSLSMGSAGATSILNIAGGTVTVGEDIRGGTGVSTLTLDGGTLDMNGSIGGSFPVNNLNFRSGTLRNVSEINDGAELTKTSTGTLILEGANTYTGVTTVSGGTLKLVGNGSFSSSPIISLAAGTLLDVAEVTGGLNFNGTSFALAPGQTLIGSGAIGGPIAVGAGSSITIGNSQDLTLSNDLEIDTGTASIEGGSLTAPAIINNGDLSITSGAISVAGVLGAGNDGTLAGGSGIGNIDIAGGSVSAGAVLLGSAVGGAGDLTVTAGDLTTNKLAGNDVTVDGGAITVLDRPGDPLDPVLDSSMVGGYLRDGAFYVNSGAVTTPNLKLGVTAGMIGAYTQTGGSTTAGAIYVGSSEGGAGEFRWSGGTLNAQSLDMAGPATLGVSLAGNQIGSGYAQLQISGHATLAGTLEIVRTDEFEPEIGDSFVIITFGSRSGEFAQVTGTGAGPGKVFHIQYNPNDVTLLVEAPAPGDCDSDGDVDLTDYGGFETCLSGPTAAPPPACDCFDLDADGDADLADFAELQPVFAE